jgi:hypothetical protein
MGERLEIRLMPGEKADYGKAADVAGESLSDWIRATLNAAAKRSLARARGQG